MPAEPDRLVSIIIPFYSHPEYLPQALESALGQTHTDLDVIVVDDGSPHDLDALLEPYAGDSRLRVIHQENAGVAAARNAGIAAARGAYLQFLDSDDWLAPEKVERHVAALEAELELGLVFCPFHFVEDGVISEAVNPPTVHDLIWQPNDGQYFDTLWAANRMIVCGPLVRRQWLLSAGGFDTSNLTEDYELWLRLAAIGCSMRNLPDALVYYRINQSGRSQDGRARARKVATRVRVLSLFPERAAEATERAMESWTGSFDQLRQERNDLLVEKEAERSKAEQQSADIAGLRQELEGLQRQHQETIDRMAEELSQRTHERDTIREWSGVQQQAIDLLTSENHSLESRLSNRGFPFQAHKVARAAAKVLRPEKRS